MGCRASLLDGFLDIDRQQHREHDGLDQAEQQAQHLHEQRQHEREEVAELVRDHFLAVEVAVQSQREGKRPHDLLDEVERQHEQEGLDEALEIAPQPAALDADGVRHAEGDDGQARRDGAARRVDVKRDILVGIGAFEVQQLGHHGVGHVIVDRLAQKDDAVVEQAGVDVVAALAARRLLDDVGDQR